MSYSKEYVIIHNLVPDLDSFELSVMGSRYHLNSNKYTFSYFLSYILVEVNKGVICKMFAAKVAKISAQARTAMH